MKLIKFFLLTFTLITYNNLFSQVQQEWVQRYNNSGKNGGDEAYYMLVDKMDNVYVTGLSYDNNSHYDFVTIKYSYSGVQQWIARYNAVNDDDIPCGIVIDSKNNIYIAGESRVGGYYEYSSIKYDGLTGAILWVRRYNNPSNQEDRALAITIDAKDNIYVTGTSATIKYDSSGVLQWVKPASNMKSIIVDNNSSIYVTGLNFLTIKYNSEGVQLWSHSFGGTAGFITSDDSSNIYVSGYNTNGGYKLIKINSAGTTKWTKIYNSEGILDDIFPKIAVDSDGSVYLCGTDYATSSADSLNLCDYLLVKYSSVGTEQWVRKYNGPGNYEDYATSIALDNSGNIYITGGSTGNYNMVEYTTLKYNSSGMLLWSKRYINGGPGRASCIVLGNGGNIFVTGLSISGGLNYTDYATIKYSQPQGITTLSNEIPKEFNLSQNYPNPFNPKTNINFQLPLGGFVKLTVFDMLGREVETLVNQNLNAGIYKVDWNASKYSSGIYYYQLTTSDYTDTKKMILIK